MCFLLPLLYLDETEWFGFSRSVRWTVMKIFRQPEIVFLIKDFLYYSIVLSHKNHSFRENVNKNGFLFDIFTVSNRATRKYLHFDISFTCLSLKYICLRSTWIDAYAFIPTINPCSYPY